MEERTKQKNDDENEVNELAVFYIKIKTKSTGDFSLKEKILKIIFNVNVDERRLNKRNDTISVGFLIM